MSPQLQQPADLILRGGTVIDGTGAPGFRAEVAIRGDRIVAVGALADAAARTELQVDGLIVAPGFIDVHTHDDLSCLAEPDTIAKISQGVTTVIVGNCGISAPFLSFDGPIDEPFNLLGHAAEFRYPRFRDYAAAVDAARPGTNIAALVGHSTLRLRCVADLGRRATAGEVAAMTALLEEALDEGALGLSSGLFYSTATAADRDEIRPLAHRVAAADGVYTAHIRDEYDDIIGALEEFFGSADDRTLPLVVSHHKCAGVRNWGRSRETLGMIDRVRTDRPVFMDCYPYVAGSTVLRRDLADGEIDVIVTWSTPHPEMAGRKLKTIAQEWGCTEGDAAERLSPGGATYFQMHEDDVRAIMRHEACMFGSDGLPRDPLPHPRLWGTFPRVLGHYARDAGLMPLEEAVRRMTGLSASTFGLADRGTIAPGMAADITVFDAARVADVATYPDPQRPSAGIAHVIVNGVVGWHSAAPAARNGRFVRRSRGGSGAA
ncbi:D-aminoacylase [Sphingomonas koreensis]|uniref:D-aminoacylase n=1 Tax=Sphingomonas koreensis TaxID=93064 RepID=A0A430G063_9SPHN|nr:D-aminoacylase [Sphingomonas koreensis]RSY79370.1 D-aminoacylase [Sphingomonas koreensis]